MFRACFVLVFAGLACTSIAQHDVLLNEEVVESLQEKNEDAPKLMQYEMLPPTLVAENAQALPEIQGTSELPEIQETNELPEENAELAMPTGMKDMPSKSPEVVVKSSQTSNPEKARDEITRETLVRWFTSFVTTHVEETICPRRVDRVFNNVPLLALGGLALGDITLRIDVDSCRVHVRSAFDDDADDQLLSTPFRQEVCPAWETVILMNVIVPFNSNSFINISSRRFRLVAEVLERFAFDLCATFTSSRRRSSQPERVCLRELEIEDVRLRQRPRDIRLIDTVTNVNICSGCLANPPTTCDLACSIVLEAIERAVARLFEELQERAFDQELPVCRSIV